MPTWVVTGIIYLSTDGDGKAALRPCPLLQGHISNIISFQYRSVALQVLARAILVEDLDAKITNGAVDRHG